jgi:two-component system, response regulator YesN
MYEVYPMALSVLIIDDEFVILKGLEFMLKNQKELVLNVSIAVDAIDAMEKVSENIPDVIITDVNMPEVDGFTFIEKVLSITSNCKFLVISGFERLDYLKRALQLHVSEFIFKPVDKVILLNKLAEFDQEKKDLIHLALFKFKMFLLHDEMVDDCSLTTEEFQLLFPRRYIAFLITLPTLQHNLHETNDSLRQYFNEMYYFEHGSQAIYVLNFSTRLSRKEIFSIWKHCNPDFHVGIEIINSDASGSQDFLTEMSNVYMRALPDLILDILSIGCDIGNKIKNTIIKASGTLHTAAMVIQNDCSLSSYLQLLYDLGLTIEDTYLYAYTEIITCYISIIGMNIPPDLIQQLFEQQKEQISDYDSLSYFLNEMLINLRKSLPVQTIYSHFSEKIQHVCTYIRQNYVVDLSLDQVADQVDFHPSYLSFIFKKEVGVTFLQFLHTTRLEKACSLLLASNNMSIEVIAAKVGYHSSTYFHKIFRTYMGVSPKQWQQSQKYGYR